MIMAKWLKIIGGVLVGLFIISQIVESIDQWKLEQRQAEQRSHIDKTKTIGYQMVQNAIESATEVIETGDDVEPILDVPYSDADGEEWVFGRNIEGGLQVVYNKGGRHVYNLEKATTGVYNLFVPKRYVSENMRMIDDGRAIEVEQGKGKKKVKAIFKTPDSTLDD